MTTEDTQRPQALDALLRSLSATTTPETMEVTEEQYWYALEVLPPKFMHGPFFTFAGSAHRKARAFAHVGNGRSSKARAGVVLLS